MNFKTLLSIAAIAAVTQVTGCTLVPVTANLDVPVAKSVAATGPAVKIVSVTDDRNFVWPHEADDCETPSTDGVDMLKDAEAKARAYSRQGRCTKGEWAMHTMVSLGSGKTVESVTRSTVEAGLVEAGYKVASSDPDALPIQVSIQKFWTGNDMDGMGNLAHTWLVITLTTPTTSVNLDASMSKKRYLGLSNPAPDDMNESLIILKSKLAQVRL